MCMHCGERRRSVTPVINPKMTDNLYVVAIDTRGIPSSDLLEGYKELTCSRRCFQEKVLDHPQVVCVQCALGELCNLTEHLTIYFHEYTDENLQVGNELDKLKAWHSYFPIRENNPGATLLTINPNTGFPKYNIQGIAYALYKNGEYPLSKEQVWGVQELACEVRDMYFLHDQRHPGGKCRRNCCRKDIARWCHQFEDRKWGPPSVYEPRHLESTKPTNHQPKTKPSGNIKLRKYDRYFAETCLI